MAFTTVKATNIAEGAITTEKISASVSLGVKISNVSIANSSYTVLDDTAVSTDGGYIVITGSGFSDGAQVLIDQTPATSVTVVNSTTIRAQVPSANAASYNLYVVNSDGSTGIRVNGLTYSGTPTWVTGSTLDPQSVDTPFNITFDATGASSYSNTTALPAGTTLLSNGYFYGTVTGIEEETLYSFTIRATDSENQDSDRTFSLTVVTAITYTVSYMIVGGGGGAGGNRGGGGGGGGFLTGTVDLLEGETYSITVGSGGLGQSSAIGRDSSRGGNTSIIGSGVSLAAVGGGRGGGNLYFGLGNGGGDGGSGGGAGSGVAAGGKGIYPGSTFIDDTRQGYNGGSITTSSGGAGGGGAGGVGSDGGGSFGQPGGPGTTGLDGLTYAAGGSGGNQADNSGGGGSGSNGTGNGGTGGSGNVAGGSGGSGAVIIRVPDTLTAQSYSGPPTITTSGGYRYYKWSTGEGNIRF
jgi:hypothetical protein